MADNPGWRQPPKAREWVLREFDLFADLDEAEMAAIAAAAPMSEVPKGQLLVSPLSPREVLFIVKKGRVRLYRTAADGRSLTTAIVDPGEMFGEMALVSDEPRSASAIAAEDSNLFVLEETTFDKLMTKRVAVRMLMNIVKTLCTRLRETNKRATMA